MNDSAIVLISVLATALTVIPVMLWMNKRERRRADQNVMRTMRRIANERTESQAILSSLNVGIVAYGSDNRLIASNPVAELYFGVIPDSLDSFLDRFGADNGIRAAYYLESDDVSGELDIDGYTLRLVCQQHPLRIDGEPFGGHIITAQDVTQFRRQEEQRKVFVANVSHELKTPLTTIKSYSETLLDWGIDEKSRDDIKSDVTRIYDDSIRMERLISDLLLLSTIDSSRLHVQMVLFDLSECARQICERFRDQSSAKSIALDFSVLSRQSIVLADRSSVERILTNLIVNAIHYTEAGGSIRVYAGNIVDDFYIKVVDDGIGIDQTDLDNIFRRFYRADKTGSRTFGGTGLGLPIAQELARMQRGRIEAESEPGIGSQFTLFLPSARRILRESLFEVSKREKPRDAVATAAHDTVRRWLDELSGEENVKYDTGSFDLRGLLDIIDRKVNDCT